MRAMLTRVDDDAFQTAFTNLPSFAYTRFLRTEQFTGEAQLLAYTEQTYRYAPGQAGPAVIQEATGGTLDFGVFHRFTSGLSASLDPPNLVDYVMVESPPYLTARHAQSYAFRLLPDTLMWDQSAYGFEVRAKPVDGDGLNIRRVRDYLDHATDQLIGLALDRTDINLLFREESSFWVHIRPTDSGTWVPQNTRFETRIRTPFRDPQHFRAVSTYSDYQPVNSLR